MDIEIEGKFVHKEGDLITVKGKAKDIINQIDIFTIKEILDLYSKDEADLDWFDDYDIENEYEDRDLEEKWDNEDMIEHLEYEGYTVIKDSELSNGLDQVDQDKLEEITELFLRGNWEEREKIYKNATKQ